MGILFYPKVVLFGLGLKNVLHFKTKEELNKVFLPLYGIDKINNQYKSTNQDPQFLLSSFITNSLDKGVYQIKFLIRAPLTSEVAKIYVDYGEGFNEENAVSIIYSGGQKASAFLLFKKKPKAIRFDPLEKAGISFTIDSFVIKRASVEDYLAEVEQQIKKTNKPTAISNLINSTLSPDPAYASWIEKYEKPEFNKVWKIMYDTKNFKIKPKISIVMPVYNTPEKYLREAIESVLNQSYPNWELCIADDASTEPHVKEVLEEYKKLYPEKIKVVYRDKNGHICEASNSALKLATGDFITFLDHDDTLAEHALYYLVKVINENPNVQIIYTDEDKIDSQNIRSEPHFKPDWSPDTLLSYNYVAHLMAIRKDIVEKVGGFRKGTEGAQDYDMILRASLYADEKNILHIPWVLYHWRMWEQSTALSEKTKIYTEKSSIKAIKDYLKAKGIKGAKVEKGKLPNTYRVIYPIPTPTPLVSIIIPTKDKVELLQKCVDSILEKTDYKNYEILIVDNASKEKETFEYYKKLTQKHKNIRVLNYNKPFNFSAICNYGVKNARGELILLLNNDTEVINSDWLTEMVRHAVRPEIGCVGAKLYYPDGTIQHAGVIIGLGGVAGHSHKHYPKDHPGYMKRLMIVQNVSAVTAACLMVKKKIYEEVGGLDEENLKVAFNDVDFCLKVREAGYRNLWTPYAELYHYESKSRGSEDTPEKVERFRKEIEYMKKKWGKKLLRDPYYNPNLTLDREDFSIRG